MSWVLQLLRNLTSGAFSEAGGQVALIRLGASSGAERVAVWDYTAGQRLVYDMTDKGAMTQVGSSEIASMARVSAVISGNSGSLAKAALADAAAAAALDAGHAVTTYLSKTPSQEEAVSLLSVDSGGKTWMIGAAADYSGLSVFGYDGARGTLNPLQTVSDSSAAYLRAVSDLASVSIGGKTFVLAGSASEHGVTAFSLGSDGRLTQTDRLGMQESVPVNTVTALATVKVGGAAFVVAGASETSSLTVMQVSSTGKLIVRDHVLDDLTTRFDGVTQLQAVSAGGRAYVVASGSDQGLTVFALTAEGRLVHLATRADLAGTALTGSSALSVTATGDELLIATTSGSEAGLTLLRLGLSGTGMTASTGSGTLTGSAGGDVLSVYGTAGAGIDAGAGDDIVTDGAGSDRLRGGTGNDIFVLHRDGKADTILDATPGQDLIDISAWTRATSVEALNYSATATGAVLTYGTETLTLISGSGGSLSLAQVRQLIPSVASHVVVQPAPLQTSTPAPVPEAGPVPVAPAPNSGVILETSPVVYAKILTGNNAANLLVGTDLNDRVYGSGGNDRLYGLAGSDWIFGGSGSDRIYTGAGNDTVSGDSGNDSIWGGSGNDLIQGSDGNDLVYAETGSDRIYGGAGNDILHGNEGNDLLFGDAGNDRLYGESGNDKFSGGSGRDTLYGGSGNDQVAGGNDDDRLYGGSGSDKLYGGSGNDALYGNDNSDRLFGDAGNDRLYGEAGNDKFSGGSGNDIFYGGSGNDQVAGGSGNDGVYGGPGNDTVYGGSGNDVLKGDSGRDIMAGDDGNDRLYGGADNDRLSGGSGNDRLFGDAGNDTLTGGSGNDWLEDKSGANQLNGGTGNDTLVGASGNDALRGEDGHDRLYGKTGNDFLTGGAGNDRVLGDAGNDRIYGDTGNDTLFGGSGSDFLYGGTANDRLDGGAGNDRLTGGSGADTFVFSAWTAGDRDTIVDFTPGTDHLRISGINGVADLDDLKITDASIGMTIVHEGETIVLKGVHEISDGDFLFR
ncbi:calcium-binding protein [Paenirhodobacter enshiensis]|uniref:calcium-binding protein n=1 Tax=Paenirhodobacter enshiensis TaxID=1105367 RepID=UPI003FA23129